jgi:hypothetical protein
MAAALVKEVPATKPGGMMRDPEIRSVLHSRLAAREAGKDNVRIVDEMNVLAGECRIDVAVINGRLEGFEIKSERDTLERLPRQVEAYGRIFDRVTVVCAERHLEPILATVPSWWGIDIAKADGTNDVKLVRRRRARANRDVEPEAVARLLWRGETLAALTELGAAHGLRSKPRQALWAALAEVLPQTKLRALVRERLRARKDWLAAG